MANRGHYGNIFMDSECGKLMSRNSVLGKN